MKPSLPTMVLLPLGTLLHNGTYRLEQLLGHRSWELTYEGTHLPSQQSVILKTLNPSGKTPNQIAHQRNVFLQRSRVWQSLQHPHLEPIRDIFVQSVLPFLVKNRVLGQTWAMLGRAQPLSEPVAIAKIAQIGSGLTLLHQHHLVHGEIRPEQVIVHPKTNAPMLMTMGRDFDATDLPSTPKNHAYTAPEQYQGQQTMVTDIYGLAATLYTLLTGEVPITALQRQHLRLEIQHPGISQTTIVAILRGMAMQPQHRPQSALEWMKLLPQEYRQPAISSAESGNIGAVFPAKAKELSPTSAALEESSSIQSSASESQDSEPKDSVVLLASKLTVSPSEPTQTVPPTRLQSHSVAPQFPIRALMICSALSGVIGIGFGLLLRFHYQNQFATPQTPTKNEPVKNEPFLPKSRPAERQLETFPTPTEEVPTESPTPSTSEGESANPPGDLEGVEATPTFPDPAPLTPETFETESPNLETSPETSPEAYPDRLAPDPYSSPYEPLQTPNLTIPPSSESQSEYP